MKTKHLLLAFLFVATGFLMCSTAQTNISQAIITGLEDNYLHTSYSIAPEPKLTNDTALIKGVDYTLSYSNNTQLGTATLTVMGIGAYTESVTKNFNIVDATRSLGYYLWDSNGDVTSTLDTLDLQAGAQIAHIQIKFDRAIQITDPDNIRNQFTIVYAGSVPENASRTVSFAVNASQPSILEITIPSKNSAVTAQASSTLSIKATNSAGWIPSITDTNGEAVNLIAIQSIQPTGIALEEVSSTVGTSTVPASAVYRVSSIPLVRSMNFLQARSSKSANTDGYIGAASFTVHSHTFYSMMAKSYVTTLLGTSNVTSFNNAGYILEKVDIDGDDSNPQVKLTASTAVEGEELSWVVYHYPYRYAADRKFELSQIIDTITTSNASAIDVANIVLYDIMATAKDVSDAIGSLKVLASGINDNLYNEYPVIIGSFDKSIVVKGAKVGSQISIYGISGQLFLSKIINTDIETFNIGNSGFYIVKVGGYTSKVIVK